ncbi:OmpA family protein [Chryseosolibacter indicus]|uniref:OmpA family protein n=1 Tax=Chryseosolibacter indicus TaxID=2782351 RepID=A0ABS5VQW7_9BACT|nr:OmpA family protein [Chryseosolibacter indicus]MBT1703220.1 OmpA family protein [Chryseosolibacter indicus]
MRLSVLLLFLFLSFSLFAQQVSSRYELVKMDKNVNTFRHEAAPVISPDGNLLYFFVHNHPDNTYGKEDSQDIWMSKKDESGVWSPAEHLRNPFNIHPYNQLFTVLPDGMFFIKGGRSKGEKGFSVVTGGSLKELEVKDFKSMNKGRFYGATMSEDMKHMVIYFSEKEGSVSSDLYVSHAQPDGSWSRPQLLKITSPQDDVGPFIGPDQKTLYFASARPAAGRQGQTDIYKTTRLDDTWNNWSPPVNIGKPINTSGEDFYFTVDNAGNVITSRANKALEGAQLDLYMLVPKTINIKLEGLVYNQKNHDPVLANVEVKMKDKQPVNVRTGTDGLFSTRFPEVTQYTVSASAEGYLPKEMKFTIPTLYNDTTVSIEVPLTPVAKKLMIAGNVYDEKTEKLIPAKLDIVARADRKTSLKTNTDDGKYEQVVPKLGWYIITASSAGYLNVTDSVQLADEEITPVTKDLYLQEIEIGVTVRLKNIYFDFDKTTLKKESFVELNKVVDFLKQNKTVEVEIAGHTDNKGSDDYNLNLSQGRSQSVVDYIISQGIDSYRLTAHGYGETKPIDSNDGETGRANNRRVEFTVVKK